MSVIADLTRPGDNKDNPKEKTVVETKDIETIKMIETVDIKIENTETKTTTINHKKEAETNLITLETEVFLLLY